MGRIRLARQSFGMQKICKDCILFGLIPWKKKEQEKNEDEQNEILKFFLNLLKVSGTFGVDTVLE